MADDDTTRILAAIERLEAGQILLRTELTASMDQLRTLLRTELMARMDRLQDSITSIRDDIAVNYGSSEAARKANDNTREEVRTLHDLVGNMMRQIQRLQSDVRTLKGEA
jgi:methyl-accepting chemotaxis protein